MVTVKLLNCTPLYIVLFAARLKENTLEKSDSNIMYLRIFEDNVFLEFIELKNIPDRKYFYYNDPFKEDNQSYVESIGKNDIEYLAKLVKANDDSLKFLQYTFFASVEESNIYGLLDVLRYSSNYLFSKKFTESIISLNYYDLKQLLQENFNDNPKTPTEILAYKIYQSLPEEHKAILFNIEQTAKIGIGVKK